MTEPRRPLPQRTGSARLGDLGLGQLEVLLIEHGWIVRAHQASDYGIDAEIELVEGTNVTGRLAKLQIKAVETAQWTDGRTAVTVRVATWNAWRNMALPVLAVLYVRDIDRLFWTTPLTADAPRYGATYLSLHFAEDQVLPETLPTLEWVVRSWHHGFENHVLEELTAYGRIYQRLVDVAEFDPFLPLDDDVVDELRLFHRHVHRLRLLAGLHEPELLPLSWWEERDEQIWQDSEGIHYATMDSLMRYLTALYRPALERIRERLEHSNETWLDVHLQRAVNWIEQTQWYYDDRDPRGIAAEFARRVESSTRQAAP